MQFQLPVMTAAVVSGVNVRSELHGDDHVPAVDVALKLTGSSASRIVFGPVLLRMLYRAARKGDDTPKQPELAGVEPVSSFPVLVCPKLEPIRTSHEFAGYRLEIDRGLGGKDSNVVLGGCSVDKFTIDAKEGGTVEMKFRVQASGLDESTIGRVASMIGAEVKVLLEAPQQATDMIVGTSERAAPPARDTVVALPQGSPRTKRGHDATRAYLDAHAPKDPGTPVQ